MIPVRVHFVSDGDFSRIDVDIEGDRRTVMCGTQLEDISDAAMDLRNDWEAAFWFWHDAANVPQFIERDVSEQVDALAAW